MFTVNHLSEFIEKGVGWEFFSSFADKEPQTKKEDPRVSLLKVALEKFAVITKNKMQSESAKQQKERYVQVIVSLIQKNSILKNLSFFEIFHNILISSYGGFCDIFGKGEQFTFKDVTIIDNTVYIAITKNKKTISYRDRYNDKQGYYISDIKEIYVGQKLHISLDEATLAKGCEIISDILAKNDIYDFKFAKQDSMKYMEQGKTFVIYSHLYRNANWNNILKIIETELDKAKVKQTDKPTDNGEVKFSNGYVCKYASTRNDYFQKDYFDNKDDFRKTVYIEHFKQCDKSASFAEAYKYYYNEITKDLSLESKNQKTKSESEQILSFLPPKPDTDDAPKSFIELYNDKKKFNFFIDYCFSYYKNHETYYLPERLISAAVNVLQRINPSGKISPNNPFGFEDMFQVNYKEQEIVKKKDSEKSNETKELTLPKNESEESEEDECEDSTVVKKSN